MNSERLLKLCEYVESHEARTNACLLDDCATLWPSEWRQQRNQKLCFAADFFDINDIAIRDLFVGGTDTLEMARGIRSFVERSTQCQSAT